MLCPERHGDINLWTLPVGAGGSRCNMVEARIATEKAGKAAQKFAQEAHLEHLKEQHTIKDTG